MPALGSDLLAVTVRIKIDIVAIPLGRLLEVEAQAVDAVAQSGGFWTVVEDMAEMRVTLAAKNLHANHPVRRVRPRHDRRLSVIWKWDKYLDEHVSFFCEKEQTQNSSTKSHERPFSHFKFFRMNCN